MKPAAFFGRILLALSLVLGSPSFGWAATLLPNGEQVFLDDNGNPLANGTVDFYVPSTTTRKDTYQNPGATILNTNPVQLDSAGRAIIYGTGSYRQVVKDSAGNTIWDQLTAATDSVPTPTAGNAGQIIVVNPAGTGFVFRAVPATSGTMSIVRLATTAEAQGGTESSAVITPATLAAVNAGQWTDAASATTLDLGALSTSKVRITGTTTISSFGTATSGIARWLRFAAATPLVYNAASMILPGGANITTAANDTALAISLGSGNWEVHQYQRAAQPPSGTVIQVAQQLYTTYATGTTVLPYDNTTPTNQEGDQYISFGFTPKSASSTLYVDVVATFSTNGTPDSTMALFVGSGTSAVAAVGAKTSAANSAMSFPLTFKVASSGTTSTSFNLRIGNAAGAATYFNGASAAGLYGGVATSSIKITEVVN